MKLKGIDHIYTVQEITDIVDGLFDSTNYKYYRFDRNGWMIGRQNIKEQALKNEITKLFCEVMNINYWLTGEIVRPNQEPTLKEIEEKESERATKYNELKRLLHIAENVPDEGKKESQQEKLHFTRHFTDKERQNLFNGLVSGGFIPTDTNYNHFCFVFGGAETAGFEPLEWQGKNNLLAYFIDNAFADTDNTNLWEITKKCFTIKSKEPNKDSLKNTVSKYKKENTEKPKDRAKIDTILSNL